MNGDRFDVLERYWRLFEAPEPSLERFLRRRDRKRRNQRIAAGLVAIAIFVVPVALFLGLVSPDRTQTPGAPRPTEPTDPPHPIGVGLVGLPPEGATPSTPERGELVLEFMFGWGGDSQRFSLHVYADGRLIWERLGNPLGNTDEPWTQTGLIEQRLTPEGVDLVLAEVLSTGLFDHDAELVGAPELYDGGIEVRADDRLVHVSWGAARFEEGETTPTPEQVRAIQRLDARLEDLGSWLPASAWETQEMRAYVPSWYDVCYSWTDEPLGRPRILDLLPAPADELLRARETEGGADSVGPGGPIPYWCSAVTTDEARELVETLEDAGAVPREPDFWPLYYDFAPSGRGHDEVAIGLDPVLPNQ